MPFDFDQFERNCNDWDDDELQKQYQKYVLQTSEGSTAAAVGYGLAFFTFGLSLVGTAIGGTTAANAGTKVAIIRKVMESRKRKHLLNTRVRDVFGGIALGGTVGCLTNGLHAGTAIAAASGGTFYPGHVYTPYVR